MAQPHPTDTETDTGTGTGFAQPASSRNTNTHVVDQPAAATRLRASDALGKTQKTPKTGRKKPKTGRKKRPASAAAVAQSPKQDRSPAPAPVEHRQPSTGRAFATGGGGKDQTFRVSMVSNEPPTHTFYEPSQYVPYGPRWAEVAPARPASAVPKVRAVTAASTATALRPSTATAKPKSDETVADSSHKN